MTQWEGQALRATELNSQGQCFLPRLVVLKSTPCATQLTCSSRTHAIGFSWCQRPRPSHVHSAVFLIMLSPLGSLWFSGILVVSQVRCQMEPVFTPNYLGVGCRKSDKHVFSPVFSSAQSVPKTSFGELSLVLKQQNKEQVLYVLFLAQPPTLWGCLGPQYLYLLSGDGFPSWSPYRLRLWALKNRVLILSQASN